VETSDILTSNLEVVERAIAFACRRYRLDPNDAEDFEGTVKLKLVENDYGILRAWEHRSSLATYISTVVQRMAIDYRIHEWGKWHASAEAKRRGSLAIELERLLYRDNRMLEEAVTILAPKHEGVTRQSLESLAACLPSRDPHPHDVAIEDAESVATETADGVEEPVRNEERRRLAEKLSVLVEAAIDKRPEEDRLALQLHYEQGMTIAQVARALHQDQKALYRQIDRCKKEIATEILRAGVSRSDVLDLIGRGETFLDLDLGKHGPRPSIPGDEKVATQSEDDDS